MKKLLVTGASGFLGWHLCHKAKQEWEVYGTYFSHALELAGVTLVKVDLTDFQALKQLFFDLQPAAVIHTAAQAKPNFCQEHPDESYPINVTASINIARLCCNRAIPCVFTSTDLVFNGLNPPYRESDRVSPISYYGLLHLGGKESISRYQFGRLMAEIWQLPQEKIKTCQQKDVSISAPRSPDVSLDSSKAFALGYQTLSLREELAALTGKISRKKNPRKGENRIFWLSVNLARLIQKKSY